MIKQEILNQEEQDQELSTVISAFTSIYGGNAKQISYSDTYNIVYKLCKKGQTEQILKKLTSISVQHFEQILNNFDTNSSNFGDYEAMIHKVQEAIQRLSEILLYIDSNYVNDSKREHSSVKDILHSIFFDQLCKNKSILLRIVQLIAESRTKGTQSEALGLIKAINDLDEKEVFLPEFLSEVYREKLSAYYQNLFIEKYQSLETKEFFLFVAEKLRQQRDWIQKHFMRVKGKKLAQQIMRKVYQASFNELKQLIYLEKSEELFKSVTLQFLQLLNEKNEAKQINDFNDWYIEQIKKRLVKIEKTNNTDFLKAFIKEYLFISQCLSGVKGFNIGYKATFYFENWINDEKLCLPKRLNIYFQDLILKNESNTEDLNNFVILFKFLKEKDYFQKQFRRVCALRMIYDPTKSNSVIENKMINEMSNQCGTDWVDKLKKLKEGGQESKILKQTDKFSAIVFEDAVWPFEKLKNPPSIPASLLALSGQYKSLYEQKYKGRAIQWHPLQGWTILTIRFKNCKPEFKMDTIMATLLLNLEKLKFKSTVKEVLNLTKLSLDDAMDQFELLEKQKIIILSSSVKNSDGQKVQITLNLDYTPNESQPQLDFTQRYLKQQFIEKHGHQQLKAQRKMMVEAFIVKIMKANKIITSKQLYNQITPMIEARGFKFNQAFVDNAFNGLIDKRYIKDMEDGNYSYLAS